MTFPPTILQDSSGSPDILGHMEFKLPVGLQGSGLLTSLLDWNLAWGSLGRLKEESYKAVMISSIWQCGRILEVLRERLE